MSHLPVQIQRLAMSRRIFSILSIFIFSISFFTAKAQNVGVNTLVPKAGLHITSNDGLLATGTFGSGIVQDSGFGTRLMWIPYLGAFRVGGINGEASGFYLGRWDPDSIGQYSFAGGINTKASGQSSFAFGNRNIASGGFSTAIGGHENEASGQYSFATGLFNRAPSSYESVFGSYATLYTPVDPLNFAGQDRLFSIGNGYDLNHRHNAMTVLKSGNVGINTTSPLYPLHVHGESAIDSGRLTFINTGGSILIGEEAGKDETFSNNNNVLIGRLSGKHLTDGVDNIGIGVETLINGNTSSSNIAIGARSMNEALSGNENVAVGSNAQKSTTTGSQNVSVGSFSMKNNSSGNHNTALGHAALFNNGTGIGQVAVGFEALSGNTGEEGNVAVGRRAGGGNDGSFNTFLGHRSGEFNNGDGNVFIGNETGKNYDGSEKLFIDNSNTATPLIYGDFQNNKVFINDSLGSKYFQLTQGAQDGYLLRSNANGHASWTDPATLNLSQWMTNGPAIYNLNAGNVGIGTNTPTAKLQVEGNLKVNEGRIEMVNVDHGTYLGQFAGFVDFVGNTNASTFIGYGAGQGNSSGGENTAVGAFALNQNINGGFNTALGNGALAANHSGNSNVGIGYAALTEGVTGSNNIGIGNYALKKNNGLNNISLGAETGADNIAGSNNLFLGAGSGEHNTGSGNVFLGNNAGKNESGSGKLYIDNSESATPLVYGDFANKKVFVNDSLGSKYFQMTDGAGANKLLQSNAAGHGTWVDQNSLFTDDWTSDGNNIMNANAGNVGIGTSSPSEKLHVNGNIKVDAGRINFGNTGFGTFVGEESGSNDVAAATNASTFIGYQAGLLNTSGGQNTALGSSALKLNTTGHKNTAIGSAALFSNQTGENNIGLGYAAMNERTAGNSNIGIGFYALKQNNGQNNISLGEETGADNLTGSNNLFLGERSGEHNTGSGNVFLGNHSGQNETGDNKLYISNSGTSTPLLYGNFSRKKLVVNDSLTSLYFQMTYGGGLDKVLKSDEHGNGKWVNDDWKLNGEDLYNTAAHRVGIGTSTPQEKLHVAGNAFVDGSFRSNNFQMTSGASPGSVMQSDENGNGSWVNPTSFLSDDWSLNGENLYNSNSQRVGIGTSTPEEKLHIIGNAIVDGFFRTSSFRMTNGGGENLILQSDSEGNGTWVSPNTIIPGFWIANGNNIYNNNTSNIGIGTSDPTEKLQLNGNLKIEQGRISFSDTGQGTMVGFEAGLNDVIANVTSCTFIGYRTGKSNTIGGENTAVGAYALAHNINGNFNTAIGNNSLGENIDGIYNTSIGYNALSSILHTNSNVAVGYNALSHIVGHQNTGLGMNAGVNNVNGINNTFLGMNAGENSLGSSNVFLGYQAGQNEEGDNKLYISNSGTSTPLIYGDFGSKKVFVNDSLGSKYLKMTNGATNGYLLKSDASGNASWVAPTSVFSDDWNSNGGNIYNANSINVGIGLTLPLDQLHVKGNLRVENGRIPFTGSGQSVWIGFDAGLNDDKNDRNNVMIGHNAGKSNTNGTANIALGAFALDGATSTNYNIAMGQDVLGSADLSGGYNLGIGNFSLAATTSGTDNIALGQNAFGSNTTGTRNIVIGNAAFDASTTGNYNTVIGYAAMGESTSGELNTVLGYAAGNNASGNHNTFIGSNAGISNTSGNRNVFLGNDAGFSETGSNKLYIANSSTATPLIYGDFSQNKITINDSLQTKFFKMTNGAANKRAMQSDANGKGSWVKPYLLFEDTTNVNIFLGSGVGSAVTTATDNTIIGSYAGEDLVSGYENTGFGKWSLQNSTSATFNTAIGHNALNANITGSGNTALGWSALSGATGASNVALGMAAGSENTSGSQNVYIGKESGMNNTGSGNVFIGHNSGMNASGSNKMYIDNSNTSSPLIHGDFTTNEVTINDSLTVGKELGVGTSTPNSTFEVNGSLAAKFRTPLVAGATQPDATGMVWRYNSGTGNIILPQPGSCPNRIYVIINQTGSTRTITTYRDLVTNTQTTLGSSQALWIMSDGSEWWQIK